MTFLVWMKVSHVFTLYTGPELGVLGDDFIHRLPVMLTGISTSV
jgi:hypothetical protein